MDITKIKNQKYYITNLELKGFKGTKEINNSDGIAELNIETDLKQQDIVLIFAENGRGKSTLLENLHAHPYMVSRDIKKSIEYPAHKKITFKNKTTRIDCEVYWISDKETKGYVYINDDITKKDEKGTLYVNTEKGNITEYVYVVNTIFLEFNKFTTSLFMQQDVLEIVKAKPAERAKIINNFSHPTVSYEDIKTKAVQKLEVIKSQMNIYEKEIEDYRGYENRYKQLQEFDEEEEAKSIEAMKENQEENIASFAKLEENKRLHTYKTEELSKVQKSLSYIDIESITKRLKALNEELSQVKENVSSQNIVENSEKIQTLNKEVTALTNFNVKIKDIEVSDIISINQIESLQEELSEVIDIIENHKHINYLNNNLLSIQEELKELSKEEKNLNDESEELKLKLTNNELNESDIDLELKEKYMKNQNLISNLTALKTHITEEIKTLKEELKKAEESIKKHEDLEILEVNLAEITEKLFTITTKEKEKQEIENILQNIEENETDQKYTCKCCQSELDKEKLEEHLMEINNSLKDKPKLLEDKKTLDLKISEIKKAVDLKMNITNSINVKEKELEHQKFSDLNAKEKTTNSILKLINLFLELKSKKDKFEDKKIEKEKRKELIKEELKDYENMPLEIILKEEISFFQSRKKKIEDNLSVIEVLNYLELKEVSDSAEIKDKLNTTLSEKEDILSKEKEEVNKYKQSMEKINLLNSSINENTKNETKYHELKEEETKLKDEITKIIFSEEEYENKKELLKTMKIEYERKTQEFLTYKKDKEFIEKLMEEYLEKSEKLKELKKEEFIYKKIKIYSDRIKKAQVSNFFGGITQTINEMIEAEEGTLSDLKVSITQKGNKNLNIETRTRLNKVEDISLLSGAEKSVVSRGISLALAKEHNFGIVYMDESDGKLSKQNKEQFFKTLRKTQQIVDTNQLFVISHNEDLLLLADKIITFD